MAPTASAPPHAPRRRARALIVVAFSLAVLNGLADVARDVLRPRPTGSLRDRLYLGGHIAKGNNVAQDTVGRWVNELACRAGDARGCTQVGRIYASGWGVLTDPERGARLYERGCAGGDDLGCANLGLAYEMGTGVKRDLEKAVALYEEGCRRHAASACHHLGICHETGVGVPAVDMPRALELFRMACDGDHAPSCGELGALYEEGAKVPADAATALAFYKHGCVEGDEKSCEGRLRLEGER